MCKINQVSSDQGRNSHASSKQNHGFPPAVRETPGIPPGASASSAVWVCVSVRLSVCVFHSELWLLPRVLKTDRSCVVSYCCVLKDVEAPERAGSEAPSPAQ